MKTIGGAEIVTLEINCESCGESAIWGANDYCAPASIWNQLPCIVKVPQGIEHAQEIVTRAGYAPRVVDVMAKPGVWASITIAPIGPMLPPAIYASETCTVLDCGPVDF